MIQYIFKKGLVIGIIVLFIGANVVSGINIQLKETGKSSRGNTLYVGGSGGGNYSSIQSAIDAASPGDTIFVYDDSSPYYENVVVGKTIDLMGEESDTTVIDGGGSGDVVYVSVDLVNITGFTIQNSGNSGSPNYDAGIDILSNSNTITGNNIISNNWSGIYLWVSSNNNTITDNTISNNGNGIYVDYSSSNTITGNNIISNNWSGIMLYGSSYNTITGNYITDSNYYGIDLWYSSSNTITGNNITDNNDDGIRLIDSSSNTITGNNISNNDDGIYLHGSSSNTITDNNITGNNCYGIDLSIYSNSNTITDNTISDNGDGVHLDDSSNNNITGNNITSNSWSGIHLEYSNNNNITDNNITDNNYYGIRLHNYSNNNNITGNNLINNTDNVYSSDSSNIWNSTSPITYTYNSNTYTNYMGNHWDDYTGSDADGDGIGDTPYNIGGIDNDDSYPLMEYFENYSIGENQPPYIPSDPNPEDGVTGVDVDADLSWTGGDPDGDTVTYDVYFEAEDSTPDILVSNDQPGTTYDPGILDYETTYYWQIIAEDEYGATTEGPVWYFTTKTDAAAELWVSPTSLSFIQLKPDEIDQAEIIIKNTGGGTLEWLITKDANWVTNIDPNNGSCESEETMIVTVEVTAPNQKDGEWNGNLYVTSNGGNITINIALTTPKISLTHIIYNGFFERLFEQYPNLFLILQRLLQRLGLQ